MQKDSAQIKGIVNLVLRDKEGRVKQHKTIRNLVTDYGLAHIVGRMIDPHQDIRGNHKIPRMMSHMALGIGAGTAVSDTATATSTYHRMLESEVGTRVQIKRDTTFNSEYATFDVAFAPSGSFTYGANGDTTIRVVSTIANAEFIRAPALTTEPALMTCASVNTGHGIAAGTEVRSITTESGGVLAITLGTAVANATGFDGINTYKNFCKTAERLLDPKDVITLTNKVIKSTQADMYTDTAGGEKREQRIVVTTNPTGADADDDFGFTTTITSFNDSKNYNPTSDSDE